MLCARPGWDRQWPAPIPKRDVVESAFEQPIASKVAPLLSPADTPIKLHRILAQSHLDKQPTVLQSWDFFSIMSWRSEVDLCAHYFSLVRFSVELHLASASVTL